MRNAHTHALKMHSGGILEKMAHSEIRSLNAHKI